jgi:hypothetical protein
MSIYEYAKTTDLNEQMANLIDSAPEELNTFKELAEALGNNPNLATDVLSALEDREAVSNKTSSLTKEATDEQYPSAKAVVDYVNNSVFSEDAVELLLSILENGVYSTDQSGTIDSLRTLITPRDIDEDGYELVKRLKSSDIMYGYSRFGEPPYYIANSGRAGYYKYDFPIKGGYSYKFTFSTSYTSTQIGLQFLNQVFKDAVDNNASCMDNGDSLYDPGWQSNGVIHTPPEIINNSPIACMGLTFRVDQSNSPVPYGFIDWVEVRRKKVE